MSHEYGVRIVSDSARLLQEAVLAVAHFRRGPSDHRQQEEQQAEFLVYLWYDSIRDRMGRLSMNGGP